MTPAMMFRGPVSRLNYGRSVEIGYTPRPRSGAEEASRRRGDAQASAGTVRAIAEDQAG